MPIVDQRTMLRLVPLDSVEAVEVHVQMLAASRGFPRLVDGVPLRHLEETGKTVRAYVNHGRWVADCLCGGGMATWPENPRCYCLDCGRAYAVKYPSAKSIAAAERELDRRPDETTRNWHPADEAAAALAEENKVARALGLMP